VSSSPITIERLERAIKTIAAAMVEHDLPGLLVYIRCLETERNRILQQADAIEYAKELWAKIV
jgi:hypothetical protein